MNQTPSHPLRPRGTRAPAFTLTEILIALALVAVLLIGISRIFAITSQTISTGQALSRAVRTQKAIQQTFAADIVGTLPTSSDVRPYSGMMPLNDAKDSDAGMPYLQICNFRVPTYRSQNDFRSDPVPPPAALAITPPVTNTVWRDLSRAIRGVDLNKDGVESQTQINLANGEMTPLFFYGERNFRCDTIGFFTRGQFQSQTGISGAISRVFGTTGTGTSTLQGELTSSEAYVWYGHARVFNSDPQGIDRAAGHKTPGEWPIAGTAGNKNNQFAEQFILSRMQMLLVEPTDHDARVGSFNTSPTLGGADRKTIEDNTVTASNDPDAPVLFVGRKWWDPKAHHIDENNPSWQSRPRPLFSPMTYTDPIIIFQRDNAGSQIGTNHVVYTNDTTNSTGSSGTTGLPATVYQSMFGRTDVLGMGSRQARQRARFLQQYDIDYPPLQQTSGKFEWWEQMFTTHNIRYWANPFIASAGFMPNEPAINAKSLAQRQQFLGTSVSQFIVEFAGDFVTQNENLGANYGTVTAIVPDGVLDFVAIPEGTTFRRQTRWYGLPRDVDGNGSIPATPATARTSPDVLPVSRIVPAGLFTDPVIKWFPFEKTEADPNPVAPSPAPNGADYAANIDEPNTATDPDGSSYRCMWGPLDFERVYTNTTPPVGTPLNPAHFRGAYPTMIRFVIDVLDENGKLAEPVTQELVYHVPTELPSSAD